MSGEIYLLIVLIILLLMFSAFFSSSETALTAASRARMHALSKDGHKGAARVSGLLEKPERLIGGILLGNNLVNNLATALSTSALIAIFGDSGIGYAVILITALILIFSEVLPKTYAILNADKYAMMVSRPIKIAVIILSPIVAAVELIVKGILRLFGIKAPDAPLSAREEIRGAIDLHHQEGTVEAQDRHMLGGVLDLKEMDVEEAMIHRKNIKMLDADLPARDIIMKALSSQHTRLPLYRGEREEIIGVMHARDLLRAIAKAGGDFEKVEIDEVMREPWFVPETTSLQEQLDAFLKERNHFALVIDEYGGLMGLITLEDILEEIVGDITDEHDVVISGVRPQPQGGAHVDGWVTIRDLNRAMHWDLPDEEAVTIAGLVIHEAQTIPEPSQRYSFHGYRFEILRRQRNQITALSIKKEID